MNKTKKYFFSFIFYFQFLYGWDTFSIAAVDLETLEIGSAGASCISGSIIISDVLPGIGVIHTQSYWNNTNQINAHELMIQGYSPEYIINWLENNDAQNNSSIRQYGIVDLNDNGRSASFSGENCYDYKGHINGTYYAIQGNILLGPEILYDMEEKFINSVGPLSDRLMEALQGAKYIGADTRCFEYNTSSLSSFLRVAKPHDHIDSLFIDFNINNLFNGIDPIDSLQNLYNDWISHLPSGDINHDEITDLLDIIFLINIMLNHQNPTLSQIFSADIDQSGIIDITDLVIISAIILS